MKSIHIFRSGTHTSAAGDELKFSESDLRATAEAYDPAKYRAPIVVGHPRTDSPAYGYVSGLQFEETEDGASLYAEPASVEPQFAELVRDGRFLAVSAALYAPTAKSNPTPGVYSLRHVGFLGAQPPAIKGLKAAEFADGEDEIVEIEFSDFDRFERMTIAGIFRRFREFLLDKFDMDTADRVIPAFAVEDLEIAAREMPSDDDAAPAAAFHEDDTMTDKTAELEQIIKAQQAENEGLKKQLAEFAENEAKRQRETARREHEAFVDGLVADGRVTPAEKGRLVAFMETLSTDPIEFADGEGATVSVSPLQAYRDQLKARGRVIEFDEVSGEQRGGGVPGVLESSQVGDISNRAIAYAEKQRQNGVIVTATQAVADVMAGKDRAA